MKAEEKSIKIEGIQYIIDFDKGTSKVGQNFKKTIRGYYIGQIEGNIIIPDKIYYKGKSYPVTGISSLAFMNCIGIKSISIPGTVQQIDNFAFFRVDSLKQIIVANDNSYFQSKEGILFDKNYTKIIRYPSGSTKNSYIIPSSVNTIGEGAFSRCIYLLNIEIPNTVTSINDNAFSRCNFKSIILPENVTKIGDESFSYCSNLNSITLPPRIIGLGAKAFYSCCSLNSLTYQYKALSFPSNVFDNCTQLNKNNITYKVPSSFFLELAQEGKPEDQYNLAMCYYNGEGFTKDFKLATDWFIKAGNQGHLLSQKMLGDIFNNGIGVAKNMVEAINWFTLAAKNGDCFAQRFLGDCYFNGNGVNQDSTIALQYYRLAGLQGESYCQYVLGYSYYVGINGVLIDYRESVKWLKLSSENGNKEAAFYLAYCYYNGSGIEQNNKEALRWIEFALNGGVINAVDLFCVLGYDDAVKLMDNGLYYLAIQRFSSVIKYADNNTSAYINRGYCYLNLQNKDYKMAEVDFRKALKLDENNETAKKDLQFVLDYYQRIKEANDLSNTAFNYYQQKDYSNAVASCLNAFSLDNTQPYPYFLIACCYFDCESYVDAISYCNKSLEVDPDYDKAKSLLKRAKTILVCNTISAAATTMANALNNINSSINNTNSSNTINHNSSSINSTSTLSTSSSSNCDTYKRQYNEQKEHAKSFMLSYSKRTGNDKAYGIIGRDKEAYKPNPALNVSMLKALRSTQQVMRNIRMKAQNEGCSIDVDGAESW